MERVDILSIDLYNLRVVFDGLVVLRELCVAICPIVQRFDIDGRSVLYFIRVVLDSCWIALHLSIDQTSVRIDDRIACIKLNRFIKVMNRVL